MNIEFNADMLDEVTRQHLVEAYNGLTLDSQQGERAFPMFSHDPDENLEQMYVLKRAFRMVINYYSIPDERIELKDEYL